MASIDEIAERAARDLRADVRGVTDVDAGLAAITGGAGTGAGPASSPRRTWWVVGWSVAAAAAVLVTFLVVRDDAAGTVVPATTPPTQPAPSTESTAVTSTPTSTATSTATSVPLMEPCDEASLFAAVAALFPDRVPAPFTSVTIDACRGGFAQVVAIADQSTCATVGQECHDSQQFWFEDVAGVWTFLDSGTGISCNTGEMSPPIEPACAAFATAEPDPRLSFAALVELPTEGCTSSGDCTTVLATLSGRLATFRPAENELTFVDDGAALTLDVGPEWMAHPLAFGPEDVLYLSLSSRTSENSGGTIAVATSGPRAGDTVATSDIGLDTSGDSTVVATAAGLVQVGCCGHGERQPATTDPLVIGWVSADGSALAPLETDVWIEYPADGPATVVRSDAGVERRWVLGGTIGGRDMPMVVPTDDGGVLLWQYDGIGAPDVDPVLYEGLPDGSVDHYDLPGFNYPSVLSPARFLVLLGGNGYVRTDLP